MEMTAAEVEFDLFPHKRRKHKPMKGEPVDEEFPFSKPNRKVQNVKKTTVEAVEERKKEGDGKKRKKNWKNQESTKKRR